MDIYSVTEARRVKFKAWMTWHLAVCSSGQDSRSPVQGLCSILVRGLDPSLALAKNSHATRRMKDPKC